ncbi:helix-turn-helix domain-containing protein [Culicoidibacter larvae]|uniref:Helix-turn-helix domain-containing protein n=1 Tax=Culicoidibacter larvae TaxID=2579976 RepID=A0A5R8Q8P4_9FIRM|nr:helix-turn-helix domain-containing protein [Culicoidibacter larvae]TLG72078.1 hypothetical protein FEZ08_09605 [Culicoidibacter larvae]
MGLSETTRDKVMQVIINSYDYEFDFCWTSNQIIATLLSISAKNVSTIISRLKRDGYINVEYSKFTDEEGYKYNDRYIYLTNKKYSKLIYPEDYVPKDKE